VGKVSKTKEKKLGEGHGKNKVVKKIEIRDD
jgi:hypothetical protein